MTQADKSEKASCRCNVYTVDWYLSYIFEMARSNLYPVCSSLKIMDCEYKTSSSVPSSLHIINTHTPTHTYNSPSTLPEATELIPPSLFAVTHGRGGSHQWSLTARLTFALATDLFFTETGSGTGAVSGRQELIARALSALVQRRAVDVWRVPAKSKNRPTALHRIKPDLSLRMWGKGGGMSASLVAACKCALQLPS